MKQLSGRVAVVTGAASGIGRAIAMRFAHEGMQVALADVEKEPLERVTNELKAAGHPVAGFPCDVSRWESVARRETRSGRTTSTPDTASV